MAEQRELAQEGKVVRGVARVPPHAAQLRAREQLSARADQQKERERRRKQYDEDEALEQLEGAEGAPA
jgi:hypothetical protein